ncbi:MAG TPA: hypothetical protein VFJ82_01655 [Longimicrobium sp.]|nr:hypothetical protein [Longimicrobium sp.]
MLTELTRRGSQRWLQVAVNHAPHTLDDPLRHALALEPEHHIEWRSPRAENGYLEYRDGAFLDLLGCKLTRRSLNDFWPTRGPMWDGLARTTRGDLLLVEAKAHIPEIISGRSRAAGDSMDQINAALRMTQQALAPRSLDYVDWSGAFYQYTNRLAHLYLLRELNGLPAHLVYVYFVNARDVGGPSEVAEWMGAIKVVEGYLGLGRHRLGKYIHKLFVDVRALESAVV